MAGSFEDKFAIQELVARYNHAIDGRAHALPDPDVLSLQGAARHTDTSDTTINNGTTTSHSNTEPPRYWVTGKADR